MILPVQIRAGRALVGWSQAHLARAADLSHVSIKNCEREGTTPRASTLRQIKQALETAGVVFIDENGGGAGVRLFKERLVGWLQCEQPYPRLSSGIPERFATLAMLQRSSDIALFARTSDDFSTEIFLISPAAARMVAQLPGDWGPAKNPSLYTWELIVGIGTNLHERFGLTAST